MSNPVLLHPIEVDAAEYAKHGLILGMTVENFFSRYWQKQAVLIRNAFPKFSAPIEANDLAGLATEEFALARLIQQDKTSQQFTVKHAPLSEADFNALTASHWTLLVQDCDKWFADVGELLKRFRFIPRWRLDDIMISWATAHGGVGAHVDQYDVFLLQGHGQRRWEIDASVNPPLDFVPDVPLKLLQSFTPTHSWILNPGDMLYLPPNVPHNGVAIKDCMTISIGLRAPSVAETLMDFAESMQDQLPEELRYSDPQLVAQNHSSEITPVAVEQFRTLLQDQLNHRDGRFERWLGGFLTRYRSAMDAAPSEVPLTVATVQEQLAAGAMLRAFPFARFAYQTREGGADVFLGGKVFSCSLNFAQLLDQHDTLDLAQFAALSASDQAVMVVLLNAGLWASHAAGEDE